MDIEKIRALTRITSPLINLSLIFEAMKAHENDLDPLSLQSETQIYERRSISFQCYRMYEAPSTVNIFSAKNAS